MSTIYLRFPDEATFLSLMPADFVQDGETGAPLPPEVAAICICFGTGRVTQTPATYAEDGETLLTPAVEYSGFHVNALDVIPPEWEPYRVTPTSAAVTFDGPR